jgi:hypothetical protein
MRKGLTRPIFVVAADAARSLDHDDDGKRPLADRQPQNRRDLGRSAGGLVPSAKRLIGERSRLDRDHLDPCSGVFWEIFLCEGRGDRRDSDPKAQTSPFITFLLCPVASIFPVASLHKFVELGHDRIDDLGPFGVHRRGSRADAGFARNLAEPESFGNGGRPPQVSARLPLAHSQWRSAIFLILELNQPFSGLFRVPSASIEETIVALGKSPRKPSRYGCSPGSPACERLRESPLSGASHQQLAPGFALAVETQAKIVALACLKRWNGADCLPEVGPL